MGKATIASELRKLGYVYLGGTARSAKRVSTGEVISRRQWEYLTGRRWRP